MPLAPVGGGVVLFYEDSGIPNATTDYTTLVLIHGIMYRSGTNSKRQSWYRINSPLNRRLQEIVAVCLSEQPSPHPSQPTRLSTLIFVYAFRNRRLHFYR